MEGDRGGKGDGKGVREKRMWGGEEERMGRRVDERGRGTKENKMVGGVRIYEGMKIKRREEEGR